jgi:hypothetical protein
MHISDIPQRNEEKECRWNMKTCVCSNDSKAPGCKNKEKERNEERATRGGGRGDRQTEMA